MKIISGALFLLAFSISLFLAPALPLAQEDNARTASPIKLLTEFRPIGAVGNNLEHPSYDPVPGSPELALAPLNFAPGTDNGLIAGPNPRTISNLVSGGSGADGQNGETNDPVASAWLYVFGQFVDHDLDLESTPTASAAINIQAPKGDPNFPAGTSIKDDPGQPRSDYQHDPQHDGRLSRSFAALWL